MLLDENAQLLNESNLQDANKVYSDKKKTINELYNNAFNFWNLN